MEAMYKNKNRFFKTTKLTLSEPAAQTGLRVTNQTCTSKKVYVKVTNLGKHSHARFVSELCRQQSAFIRSLQRPAERI